MAKKTDGTAVTDSENNAARCTVKKAILFDGLVWRPRLDGKNIVAVTGVILPLAVANVRAAAGDLVIDEELALGETELIASMKATSERL